MSVDTVSYKGMLLNRVLTGLIRIYRLILSPLFGPACRFTPSCSCYAMDALAQYPVHRALPRILYRLLKCNPLSRGGYDPVITKNYSDLSTD